MQSLSRIARTKNEKNHSSWSPIPRPISYLVSINDPLYKNYPHNIFSAMLLW